MKYIALLFTFILFSCGTENEKVSTQNTTNPKPTTPTKKCDPTQEPHFKGLIENSVRLGFFEGGAVLNQEKIKAKGYQFSGVDTEENIVQHVFTPDMREFMIVRESKKDHIIREITLLTRDYLTNKCIGVKSTLEEFIEAYPDYEIGYDAGNDSFYLATPELMGVKFNILTTTFQGDPSDVSPRNKYTKEQFEANTPIVNVYFGDF